MGVKTNEWLQAHHNLVINLFKQGKKFRLIQEATGMALGTISNLIKRYKRFAYKKNQPRSGARRKTIFRIDQQTFKVV